jgi:peroxiredoxin
MKYFLFSAMICLAASNIQASLKQSIHISGNANKGDTVMIKVWDHYLGSNKELTLKHRDVKQVCVGATFSFRFDNIKGPVFYSISVTSGRKFYTIDKYLAMPGDNVHINQDGNKHVSFTGKGAVAMACRFSMDSAYSATIFYPAKEYPAYYVQKKEALLYLQSSYQRNDSGIKMQRFILEERKNLLSDKQYKIFLANIIGKNALVKCLNYITAISIIPKTIGEDSVNHIKHELVKLLNNPALLGEKGFSDETLFLSRAYLDAVILSTALEAKTLKTKSTYQLITDRYEGSLRDQLLTIYLLDPESLKSVDSLMISALKIIKTGYCREAIQFILSNYLRGVTAYNFTLPNASGNMRKLSDFKGKKVVMDYWYTGCLGCTQFYKNTLESVEKELENDTSVVFISIAKDTDRKTWLESVHKNIYTSLSAINLIIGKLDNEHPAITKYGIKRYPTLVIIDEYGKIFYNGDTVKNKEELIALIKSK